MTRRDWLRRLATAGAAGVVPGGELAPALAASLGDHAAWLREALPALPAEPRRLRAYDLRVKAAFAAASARVPRRDGNTDESRVPAFLAKFSKGLPHDAFGIVDPEAYRALARAAAGAGDARFEDVPVAGARRLVSPQAAFAFALDGLDVAMLDAPDPPAWESAAFATEAVEAYWLALLRDVPFTQYPENPLVARAAADLTRAGRETTAGDPVLPTPDSRLPTPDSRRLPIPPARGSDGGPTAVATRAGASSRGGLPLDVGRLAGVAERADAVARRHVRGSALHLLRPRSSRRGPGQTTPARRACRRRCCSRRCERRSRRSTPTSARATRPDTSPSACPSSSISASRVAMHALRASWFQKWVVHRRLRPEELGGRLESAAAGAPIVAWPDARLVQSDAFSEARRRTGTCLLPVAWPEGAPLHPAYPAAHAATAGAMVTVLKAYYAEEWLLPDPVEPSPDGSELRPIDVGLTVGGELDKLAWNLALGRAFAGVQWRSDAEDGLRLGEAVAVALLRELRDLLPEPHGAFTLRAFNGLTIRNIR